MRACAMHVFKCIQESEREREIAKVQRRKWINTRSLHTLCTHLDDYKIIKGNEAIECIQASLQPFMQSSSELSLCLPFLSIFLLLPYFVYRISSVLSLSFFTFSTFYFTNDNKLWENLFIKWIWSKSWRW